LRIGIDARFLTHPQKGGFKTYTENLVTALSEVDSRNEYVLYLDRLPQEQAKLPVGLNVSHRVVPGLAPFIGMAWREQVSLPCRASTDGLDLFHSPCLTAPLRLKCPRVVTIHDMIWRHPPRTAGNGRSSARRILMQWYYRLIPLHAARKASLVITVSRASKDRIVKSLAIPQSRVLVTYEAAPRIFRKINEERSIKAALGKYGLPPRFILGIGSADPRKNVQTLLRAYASMAPKLQESHQLAIILTHSSMGINFLQQAHALGLTGRVRFLENVPDNDLVLLYNAAILFVFPSVEEGFGLPLLEAMACGVPVIASDNSSFPEIAADAAILVEAQNADAIGSAMTEVLTHESIRQNLRARGFQRAGSFSWERCALQTIRGYEQALRLSARQKPTVLTATSN
jgi:glycosyltransferase involved in cell wall biosynthesis